ncbi:hypothetical protein ACFFX1_54920 [Dactylosporangium sucinum]|uniref:Uncharacterized protein n=1 Tax=Dactylosporangium sucinum TaxID=1424081 RepID=A0A917U2U7_9ACTN|nr:hypothetical protein [Dactylosporangium sucinum]GGM53416.1 hypothetical protein GCM10007977_063760 [Dactylosporangium sucinum]
MEFAKSAVNWGSVPDWIAGIGSVLAFAGLAFGLWWEARQRRLDRLDADSQQARLVFAEVADYTLARCLVRVRNNSDHPVYDVEVELLAPGSRTQVGHRGIYIQEVPAHSSTDTTPSPELLQEWVRYTRRDPFLLDPDRLGRVLALITFVDGAGRAWKRYDTEAPTRQRSYRG